MTGIVEVLAPPTGGRYQIGGARLTGARIVPIHANNVAIGADQDIGTTVPAGKRWYVSAASFFNQSAGNITAALQFKSGGVYYRLTNTTTTIAAGGQFIPAPLGFLLEAGESLAVTVSTTNGLNVHVALVEFDDTSPLKRALKVNPSTGDNLLYTCPAGKTAILLAGGIPFSFSGSGSGNLAACADTFGSRTFVTSVLPNGGTLGANHRVSTFASNADTRTAGSITAALEALDAIWVNVNVGDAKTWFSCAILEM